MAEERVKVYGAGFITAEKEMLIEHPILEEASDDYTKAERNLQKGVQVVLVSGVSVKLLTRAYPNYFLDTTDFIKALDRIS